MCSRYINEKCYVSAQKNILKPPGSLLLTVLRRRLWCNSYFVLIGVGVLCRISYFIVNNLYVTFSWLITSVGEERANFFSAIVYL